MTYFYHAVIDSPHLPREFEHDSTQNTIVTILGEFWRYSPALAVPSAALIELLEGMGISPVAGRAALSRLGRRNTLSVVKTGRNTAYALAPDVAETIPASELLTMSFGKVEREWDGEWTVVIFSIPETQRELRQSLREWLRWLGFGPARDGVWISPHADIGLMQKTLEGLLPDDGLVFKSAHIAGDLKPFDVWPLAELHDIYRAFIEELRPIVYRLRSGMVSPAEALKLSVTVLAQWRGFPTVDPDLPSTSLPADWPRREARRLFAEVYDACIPLAELHVKNVVSKYDQACAAEVHCFTVDESIDYYETLKATEGLPAPAPATPHIARKPASTPA
jgi:phenylacetic acid degradation operon negative regulatory protein